jgi:hypothetical protein
LTIAEIPAQLVRVLLAEFGVQQWACAALQPAIGDQQTPEGGFLQAPATEAPLHAVATPEFNAHSPHARVKQFATASTKTPHHAKLLYTSKPETVRTAACAIDHTAAWIARETPIQAHLRAWSASSADGEPAADDPNRTTHNIRRWLIETLSADSATLTEMGAQLTNSEAILTFLATDELHSTTREALAVACQNELTARRTRSITQGLTKVAEALLARHHAPFDTKLDRASDASEWETQDPWDRPLQHDIERRHRAEAPDTHGERAETPLNVGAPLHQEPTDEIWARPEQNQRASARFHEPDSVEIDVRNLRPVETATVAWRADPEHHMSKPEIVALYASNDDAQAQLMRTKADIDTMRQEAAGPARSQDCVTQSNMPTTTTLRSPGAGEDWQKREEALRCPTSNPRAEDRTGDAFRGPLEEHHGERRATSHFIRTPQEALAEKAGWPCSDPRDMRRPAVMTTIVCIYDTSKHLLAVGFKAPTGPDDPGTAFGQLLRILNRPTQVLETVLVRVSDTLQQRLVNNAADGQTMPVESISLQRALLIGELTLRAKWTYQTTAVAMLERVLYRQGQAPTLTDAGETADDLGFDCDDDLRVTEVRAQRLQQDGIEIGMYLTAAGNRPIVEIPLDTCAAFTQDGASTSAGQWRSLTTSDCTWLAIREVIEAARRDPDEHEMTLVFSNVPAADWPLSAACCAAHERAPPGTAEAAVKAATARTEAAITPARAPHSRTPPNAWTDPAATARRAGNAATGQPNPIDAKAQPTDSWEPTEPLSVTTANPQEWRAEELTVAFDICTCLAGSNQPEKATSTCNIVQQNKAQFTDTAIQQRVNECPALLSSRNKYERDSAGSVIKPKYRADGRNRTISIYFNSAEDMQATIATWEGCPPVLIQDVMMDNQMRKVQLILIRRLPFQERNRYAGADDTDGSAGFYTIYLQDCNEPGLRNMEDMHTCVTEWALRKAGINGGVGHVASVTRDQHSRSAGGGWTVKMFSYVISAISEESTYDADPSKATDPSTGRRAGGGQKRKIRLYGRLRGTSNTLVQCQKKTVERAQQQAQRTETQERVAQRIRMEAPAYMALGQNCTWNPPATKAPGSPITDTPTGSSRPSSARLATRRRSGKANSEQR